MNELWTHDWQPPLQVASKLPHYQEIRNFDIEPTISWKSEEFTLLLNAVTLFSLLYAISLSHVFMNQLHIACPLHCPCPVRYAELNIKTPRKFPALHD